MKLNYLSFRNISLYNKWTTSGSFLSIIDIYSNGFMTTTFSFKDILTSKLHFILLVLAMTLSTKIVIA